MTLSRCNRNYHRMKIHVRGTFASAVLESYYKNNPPFTAPVIPKADFEKLQADYHSTYADYANGGNSQKGAWLMAKTALLQGLDQIADNVDEVANGNELTVAEGGFQPIKTFRSGKNEPPTPEIEKLWHGAEGEILARCKLIEPNIYYGCIISEGAPLPDSVQMMHGRIMFPSGLASAVYIDETKSRKKTFRNLKPGTRYYVYFFARNSAGVSLLSDTRSIICA